MAIINILPYTLTNGTLADASQVMANFNQIVNNVNSLTTGGAGVNLANTFLQLNSFQVGLQAGGSSQFGLDASGNLTTSSTVTINANILTLAGSLYTNTFNADGTATINGTWAFAALCTFINPTAAQNPVTLTYAQTNFAAINGSAGKNFATDNLTVAGTLGVTGQATFTDWPICSNSTAGQVSAAGTVILDTPVLLGSITASGSFYSFTLAPATYPSAKIAIVKITGYLGVSVNTTAFVYLRRNGTSLVAGAASQVMAGMSNNASFEEPVTTTTEIGLDSSGIFQAECSTGWAVLPVIYLLGYRT